MKVSKIIDYSWNGSSPEENGYVPNVNYTELEKECKETSEEKHDISDEDKRAIIMAYLFEYGRRVFNYDRCDKMDPDRYAAYLRRQSGA